MRLVPFLLFLVLVAGGCDSSTDEDGSTLRAPGGRTPVAGAIEFRSFENVLLGTIGSGPVGSGIIGSTRPPAGGSGDGGVVPAEFSMHSGYPSPFRTSMTTSFSLPRADHVSVFVVAALPPGTVPSANGSNEQNAWMYRPGGLPVDVLFDGPLVAGDHAVQWYPAEAPNAPLPYGYYRIYVQTPYAIAWRDVLYSPEFFFN